MADCPHCEYHKQRAQIWRDEVYRLAGHPLPEPEPERESELEKLKRCLFQMQEAAKDLVQQAQPKQEQGEPVALKKGECWPEEVMHQWDYWRKEIANGHKGSAPRDWFEGLSELKLIDTTPQQRTWVGLTDKEIDEGLVRSNYAMQTAGAWRDGVEWATKQLKGKNT